MAEGDLIVNPECGNEDAVYSEEYADYILTYFSNLEPVLAKYRPACYQPMNIQQVVIYEKVVNEADFGIERYGYRAFPHCYGLMDMDALGFTGVLQLRRLPYLDLLGNGVLIAFIDTGIEYTHPAFVNDDNTTRIFSIWDQTIRGGKRDPSYIYGTEYGRDEINAALASGDPLSVVPSTDTDGHGTFMAGVAAGRELPQNDFSGIAPQADIIVVKLKEAKQRYRDYYNIPDGVPCYQENDIMAGLSYVARKAVFENKPLVVCLGLGTNSGDHEGTGPLGFHIDYLSSVDGLSVVVSAGNETGYRHHYQSGMVGVNDYIDVDINVGAGEKGFVAELWAGTPNLFSVGVVSPSGEFSQKIAARMDERRVVSFLLEQGEVEVVYEIVEAASGDELVFMRFVNPDSGIWKIRVYNEGRVEGNFSIWLPIRQFMATNTNFNQSSPDILICEPGNVGGALTVAGYSGKSTTVYINSSRGYTRKGRIKPDLAAPAMDVFGTTLGGGYGVATGTSVAAAIGAGVAALFRQWAMEQGLDINGYVLNKYLTKGTRRGNTSYPNREWGYGMIDIYQTFQSLRTTL